MGWFSDIKQKVIEKKQQMDDRKQFLDMVEEQAKPIRRAAYMKQMFKEVVSEGKEKAKLDAAKRKPKQQKTPQEFGIMTLEDPYKFLNNEKENKK